MAMRASDIFRLPGPADSNGMGSPYPALTDLTLDAVAALEGCVQAGDGVH